MYSDRNVTSRPLIVILGIKFFLAFFLDKVMGSRLYMYIVVRHIVKDVSHSSVCASLGGDQCRPLSTCIEFQRREGEPRPRTALQWGREEAVQFMQLTQASVSVFITSQGHSWTLLSERRGFAGRCLSYINA